MSQFPRYLNLRIGAVARLQSLRALNRNDWRKARAYGYGNASQAYCHEMNAGSNDKARVWCTFTGQYFRTERYADEIAKIDHRGWYTDDEFQDATCRGIVASLPHGRFLAGYEMSETGERVWFDEAYEDDKEAARAGDGIAERLAEQEREYQARWRAARDLEDDIETKLTRLRECMVLRHQACMAYVRKEVPQLVRSVRDARHSLATEFKDVAA